MLFPYKLAQNGLTKAKVCHIIIPVAARTAAEAAGRSGNKAILENDTARARREKRKSE